MADLTPLKQRPATAFRRVPVPPGSVLLVPNRSVEPAPEPEPEPFQPPPVAQWDVNTRGRTDNDFYEHMAGVLETSTGAPPVDSTGNYDALDFQAPSHWCNVGFPATLAAGFLNADFTVAIRVAPDPASISGEARVFSFANSGNTFVKSGLLIDGGDLDKAKASLIGDNNAPWSFLDGIAVDGQETVLVWRRTNNDFSLWQDGVKTAENLAASVDVATINHIDIGAWRSYGTVTNHYDGRVYWAAIWDQALTDEEVQSLSQTENPFSDPVASPPDPDPGPGPGDIPSDQELRDLGYILAIDYPGVDPTGQTDSTTGLQAALQAAINNNAYQLSKPLWLHSGTYLVSDTIRGYVFNNDGGRDPFALVDIQGATNPSRPVIKLTDNAPDFQDYNNPRPVFIHTHYSAPPGQVYPFAAGFPSDWTQWAPYDNPPNTLTGGYDYYSFAGQSFGMNVRNVDIDVGANNPGADGVSFMTGQNSYVHNAKINVTGGNVGIRGGAGRGGCCMGVEVVGGRLAVSTVPKQLNHNGNQDGCAGYGFVGFKASGQAVAVVENDFPGDTIYFCGAEISADVPVMIFKQLNYATGGNTAIFYDLTYRTANPSVIPFDDTAEVSCYLRNVNITGTDNVFKAGATTITQAGAWKRVNEIAINDQRGTVPWPGGTDWLLRHYALIDGVTNGALIAVNDVVGSVEPAVNYADKHTIQIHQIDQGAYVNADDYAIDPSGAADSRNGFIAAIAAAESAGHNRVAVPAGSYQISGPITLRDHTKFFAIAQHSYTEIKQGSGFVVTTNNQAALIETPDKATANCSLQGFALFSHQSDTAQADPDLVHWKCGGDTFNLFNIWGWISDYNQANSITCLRVTGNGGGRHFQPNNHAGNRVNEDTRTAAFIGTTNPAWVYGIQTEISKGFPYAKTNFEFTNCANVRCFGGKREGNSPTTYYVNADNCGWFHGAAMRHKQDYWVLEDNSTNIVFGGMFVFNADDVTLDPDVNTVELRTPGGAIVSAIQWPYGCSVFKRGELNDTVM